MATEGPESGRGGVDRGRAWGENQKKCRQFKQIVS
jgi:hypothetical protein